MYCGRDREHWYRPDDHILLNSLLVPFISYLSLFLSLKHTHAYMARVDIDIMRRDNDALCASKQNIYAAVATVLVYTHVQISQQMLRTVVIPEALVFFALVA